MTKFNLFRSTYLIIALCGVEAFLEPSRLSKQLSSAPQIRTHFTKVALSFMDEDVSGLDEDNPIDDEAVRSVDTERPIAALVDVVTYDKDLTDFQIALQQKGFSTILLEAEEDPDFHDLIHATTYRYKFQKATGMLQLLSTPNPKVMQLQQDMDIPKWIPVVSNMENIIFDNGSSILDPDKSQPIDCFDIDDVNVESTESSLVPDESEPIRASDIDTTNVESTYRPRWMQSPSDSIGNDGESDDFLFLSLLGYGLKPMTSGEIQIASKRLNLDFARNVLLEGGTESPNLKQTNNGYSFTGAVGQADLKNHGIFVCAMGGLPLFSTVDLDPSTATSGWLLFERALSDDHIGLVDAEPNALDARTQAICAKSKCHLGHYYGQGHGYCINASALNFIPLKVDKDREGSTVSSHFDAAATKDMVHPISWRTISDDALLSTMFSLEAASPSVLMLRHLLKKNIPSETIVFGAGCFWRVEAALRRLPGVMSTTAGYCGGMAVNPTYDEVCRGETGHAEVVKVEFDPTILDVRHLVDLFLAIHDPTKERAHGKHVRGTGQYRSCIFFTNREFEPIIHEELEDCSLQVGKELITTVHPLTEFDLDLWFWKAEDKHQRREERKETADLSDSITLTLNDWFDQYGRRSKSILGSDETINDNTLRP